MKNIITRELDYLKNGFLTFYILKIIEGLPKVDMQPYSALIAQEIENGKKLGASKSMLHSRLKVLSENGFLEIKIGASSNPKAKKPVQFFYLNAKGRQLLKTLEKEQERIRKSLSAY